MKLSEAILTVDDVYSNAFTTQQKVKWIETLDQRIYEEIIKKSEGYEEYTFPEYEVPGEGVEEQTLLVVEPYSELYIYYLLAKINFFNAEYGRYNNASTVYNQTYADYAAWYNSNNMPLQVEMPLRNTESSVLVEELDI